MIGSVDCAEARPIVCGDTVATALLILGLDGSSEAGDSPATTGNMKAMPFVVLGSFCERGETTPGGGVGSCGNVGI